VTSAYARPLTRTDRTEGESHDNPTGGGEWHFFLAGNRAVLLDNRRFPCQEIAGPPSLLKKRFFLKKA